MTDDRDDKPDNVFTFPNLIGLKDSGGPVSAERRQFLTSDKVCVHGQWGAIVNENDRTVRCKRCDKPVDAFDALLSLARHWDWEHTRQAARMAKDEAERARKELEELRSQRAKVRRTGSVSVSAVNKVFTALIERLKRAAAAERGVGRKATAEALTDFERWISRSRSELVEGRAEAGDAP